MLIAITSDIHDNIPNLSKCLFLCQEADVQEMICCGDVANYDTLKFLSENFLKPVHLVRGNADIYEEDSVGEFGNIKFHGRVGRFQFDKTSAGFCHEPFLFDHVLKNGPCDLIFYGHTHKPWIEDKGGVKFINPGNISGTRFRASFALWDTDKEEPELRVL
jgi:uncharacterized protein